MKNLHPMTKEAVERLLKETGHVLTVDDFAHISELNIVARRVTDPLDDDNDDILSAPKCVGGYAFYPLTVGAAKWVEDYLFPWFSDDEDLRNIGLLYVLTVSMSPQALYELSDKREAASTIKRWANRLKITPKQAKAVIEAMYYGDGDGGSGAGKYGPVIALLCREYGASPEYWMWEASIGLCRSMLNDWEARQAAESEAMRRAASKVGRSVAPGPTAKMRNIKRFKDLEAELRALWAT